MQRFLMRLDTIVTPYADGLVSYKLKSEMLITLNYIFYMNLDVFWHGLVFGRKPLKRRSIWSKLVGGQPKTTRYIRKKRRTTSIIENDFENTYEINFQSVVICVGHKTKITIRHFPFPTDECRVITVCKLDRLLASRKHPFTRSSRSHKLHCVNPNLPKLHAQRRTCANRFAQNHFVRMA